jgi:hypothetical protein
MTIKNVLQLLPPQPFDSNSAESVSKSIKGTEIFYLDGQTIDNKKSFLAKIAEVMRFPEYFGNNWDALEDCLTDLEWCPASRYILIYDAPDIFAQAEPDQWEIARDILQSTVAYWQNTSTPLDVLLIGQQR